MFSHAGRFFPSFFVLIVFLTSITACNREEEGTSSPSDSTAVVHANETYRSYFGEPPAVSEGTAFALVGFAPDPDHPGKISPFPLFMFDRDGQMEAVAEQVMRLGFDWDPSLSGRSPFPAGTFLVGLHRDQDDLVRVELSEEAWALSTPHDKELMIAILGNTLTQFPNVQRVIVAAGGHLLPGQTDRGFFPDPEVVVGPGAPRLLAVVGVWEPGGTNAEEVAVYFDRPLDLKSFRLMHADGKEVAGDYFRSIFNMAVVVHPRNPEIFKPGLAMRVIWEGVDSRGRSWGGDNVVNLQRLEHQ